MLDLIGEEPVGVRAFPVAETLLGHSTGPVHVRRVPGLRDCQIVIVDGLLVFALRFENQSALIVGIDVGLQCDRFVEFFERVPRVVPVTCTRMVATCVPRQVAYEVCRVVPVTACCQP